MNTFKPSENDFRFLLAASAFLPILCFIAGLYTANSFDLSNIAALNTQSMPLTQNIPTKNNPVRAIAQAEQDRSVKPIFDGAYLSVKSGDEKMMPVTGSYYLVQAGVFSRRINAIQFQYKLHGKDIDAQIIETQKKGRHIYRIILDTFISESEAIQFLKSVKEKHDVELYVVHISDNDRSKTIAAL
ncbi:MAG: SPOR domain-containing protein [Pseudomonadales bacterium]